ncbi:hypothetical protein CYMTET_28096 [Cymbomonas tetramitiformis]|uniref:Uncharacterized protein n=1 Tax=Cymbomonas tetramitiformis TaxID=36881 RepID=A0AAE0FNU4_9CHLO|nr:hypothetical protein CYMTET_28096 [Cymbomonas tetramitiformis]
MVEFCRSRSGKQWQTVVLGVLLTALLTLVGVLLQEEGDQTSYPASSNAVASISSKDAAFASEDETIPSVAWSAVGSSTPPNGNVTRFLVVKPECRMSPVTLEYTINRLRNSTVSMSPYPHLHVVDVFEPGYYSNCILHYMPPDNLPATEDVYSKINKNQPRYGLKIAGQRGPGVLGHQRSTEGSPFKPLTGAILKNAEPTQSGGAGFVHQFWVEFGKAFGSAELRDLFLDKFAPTLKTRGINLDVVKKNKNAFFALDLSRDLAGYAIGAHTDSRSKLVTTLFYLPRDTQLEYMGTMVVQSKSGRTQQESARIPMKLKDLKTVKTAPFVPNAMFAFAPCTSSWHAVRKLQAGHTMTRDTIQGFIKSPVKKPKAKCPKR